MEGDKVEKPTSSNMEGDKVEKPTYSNMEGDEVEKPTSSNMEGDTVERPTWLTNQFLEKTLRSREGFNEAVLLRSIVHSAVGKGDNYTSAIYRVELKYKREVNANKNEETRLIIKTLSPIEFLSKFLIDAKAFEKETKMIKDIIPKMCRILEEKHPENKVLSLSAYCYESNIPHALILEDLTTLGFKMADRHSQLDLEHSILALKGLAKFHALSVALNDKDPSILEEFKTEFIYTEKYRELTKSFTQTTFGALINVVERWNGYEKYADKIRAVIPGIFDRLAEQVKPKPNSLNVLLHGDCWVNNMMFHYSPITQKVDQVRFIDFQIARFSSPALDLQYFVYTSPKESVRSEKTEYLLEEYHRELCFYLRILDQADKLITLEELKKEFEEKAFFGFNTACSVLSAVLAEPCDAFDMENFNDDGSGGDSKVVEKTYSGNRYKDAFQKLLPHFESKGVI